MKQKNELRHRHPFGARTTATADTTDSVLPIETVDDDNKTQSNEVFSHDIINADLESVEPESNGLFSYSAFATKSQNNDSWIMGRHGI